LHVVVDVEAELVGVERLGPVDVADRDGDEGELELDSGRLSGMSGHLRTV